MNEYSNTSVLDQAKSKIQLFKTLNNPSFDSQGVLHDLQHPGFMSTPDEYGFTDWVRDAWTDWNIMRNETNYSSELGKYQLDQVKVNELDNAEDYLRLVQYNAGSEDKVEIPEELGEEYSKLAKEYKLSGSIDEQISQIGKHKEDLFASQNDALNEAKKYQDEAQDWRDKHDLSDYYEYKKEEGEFDQYNLDSYLYKLPGIFGSSSASLGLQALGLAAGLGASVALSALTGGTATPLIAAALATGLSATALGANIASADRENKAEVFDNMKTRIIEQSINDGSYQDVIKQAKTKLNDDSLTDDQVMDKILTNQVEVQNESFNKSVHKALTGVEQLYASDMATVLGTESIETALTVVPFGALSKLGKLGKLGKAVNIASEKKGKLVDAITDRIDKVKYFGIDKSIKGMADKTKRGFILDLAGRQFVQASSEMVEESNQYLAAQEYIEGKYDGMQPSYIKGIADSWKHGARSLYSFYAPWDTALTSDKEWLENSRSGFVLGLLNVPNLVTTGVNARRAYKQVQGDKFVQDVAADDVFADKDRLNKNITYAQHAINNREEEIYRAFDKAKEIGLEGIDAQMWDEERDHAVRIVNRANSKKIQQLAEERDIKKGTEDFNIYVGMIDYYEERAKEASEKYNERANEANKLLSNQQLFEDKFDAEYGISQSEFEALSEEDKEAALSNKAYIISRATTNARLSAYESILNDIDRLEQDAEGAHAKFGITYNKKDLNKAKSIIKKRYDTVLREDEDASSERDVELSSIQHDLINAYKHATWAEVDMLRANEDLAAVLTSKKNNEKAVEETKSRIAQYKKVQKQNQEFEQQLQDDHRNEEQPQEEVQSVEIDEEKIEQVENPTITQNDDIVWREVDEEQPIEKVEQPIVQQVEQKTEEKIEEKPKQKEQPAVQEQLNLTDRAKELSQARQQIVETTTEVVSEHKAKKNRDDAMRRAQASGQTAEQSLDYYSQGIKHVYNRDNKYGKAHENASDALVKAVEQVDTEIGQIMTQLVPENAWKYSRGTRAPFFVQQDVDYLFSVADVEKDNTILSTELKGVLGAFDDLMALQGRLEEAISDVDVESADKLIPQIDSAIEKLNSKVDIYNNRNGSVEDTNLRNAKEPSYSEKGHRLINAGQTQEESNDFIANSAKPDFIINSTVSFEVLPDRINVVFDYNGKKIRTRLNPDSSAIGIINKIREYQKQADGVNKQIVPIGIARTAGRIQHGAQDNNLSSVKDYWTLNDVYQINPENTVIGIGTREGIKRGNTILQKGNNYELGRSYWMVNISRPETPNHDRKVPVHLNPVKIGNIEGLAEIILQCYEQYNQQFFTTKEGVQTPIDPVKLLDFIVYNGNDSRITEDKAKMYQPEHLANMLKKQLFLEDGKLTIGTIAYDIVQLSSNPELRKQAIENINSNLNFRINDENLYSNWGSEELKETNPFYGLKSWFDLYKKDKLTILPGVLEFDKKMVGLDPSAPKGISVLGYYIKNGLIKTDFVGMTDALIYIKDVALVEKDNGKTEQQIEESVLDNPGVKVESADDLSAFFEQEFGAKFTSDQLSQQQDENELRERARTIIRKLTGLNNVETEDDILGVTQSGLYILGKAQLDSITLSTYAPVGIEYHESWHRISNLLMEDKQREKLFNRMRKKYGKELSDVEIDEILAERFKEFQLGVAENIDYSVTSLFKRAWNFIKALVNLKDLQLAWLYTAINRGEFAKLKPSKERIERFKNLYGEQGALYTYRGHEFKEFNNSQMIDGAIDGLIYLLFNMPDKLGNVTRITDYTDINKLSLDRLKTLLAASKSPVYQELHQNFDLIQDLMKQKLKKIQVNLLTKEEQEELNEEKDEDLGKIDMDDYTKASYEVDPYSNAPAEVKFFFTTIPEKEWRDGQMQLVKNPITGLPKFFNPRLTWNIILNDLHSATTIQEMVDLVNKKAQTVALYAGVKSKLDKLVERSKGKGEDAIQAEATLTKMLTTIHSNKNSFLTVRGTVETVEGKTTHSLDVIDNTAENKSRALPSQYSQALFLQGGILEINSEQGITFSQNGEKQLNAFLSFYDLIQRATQNGGKFKTKKGSYDLHDVSTQSLVKDYIVQLLNGIGISIDTGTIDEMLSRPVFGDGSEYDKLVQFLFTNTSYWGGMQSLVKRLTALRDQLKAAPKGLQTIRVGEQDIEIASFYNSNGFVKELAKAFIQYHSNYDNLMAIGAGNNLLYASSQNNFSTDTVDELNNNPELIEQLENIPYTQASLLVQQAKAGNKFRAQTFVNFRTNNPNDVGNDYHQITDAEDYLSKMTLILNNRLIFPTVADKKTYHVIDGVQLPNERLTNYGIVPYVGMRFGFGIQTINQIIAYTKSELASIEHCINQLTPGHPDYLPEDQRIKNYHTKNKYKVGKETYPIEPNGTRFQFLSGVYIDNKFVSFNDPRKTSAENLKTAKEKFFNQPVEKQIMMINELLSRRVLDEIQYAVDKGIIEYDETNHLVNKLLDDDLIKERAEYYSKKGYKNPQHIAIVDIISQYTNNSIISISEVERVFSGNPAFYKWNYDQFGIIDASIDKIKRLGSLTSTGINNRLDFEDFDPMYTCAELKDFEIGSRQFKDTLVPLFIDSSIREVVKQVHGIQATLREDGSNKTVDELKSEFPKEANLAEIRAKKEVAGYGEGINVADAAVYVTPEFYARMMRSIGMWGPEIAEAYRILTEPANETERNWESQAEAYHKVMKASYKPLKYMAFGRRIENGLAVPYFNKMALFPLFESVATGDIRKLYERMTDAENPIDMVLFESAVKAGSKNPLSWKDKDGEVNDLSKFTTYKQNMRYLRQQLATDPHTHEEQMAGTQMLKVALANLDLLGNYGFGENKVKGEVIRDTIFSAMNELSNRGRKRIEDKLLGPDGKVSEEKLSKMLMEDLETQDADNNILDGVTFNPETGRMNLSLSAISNNSWLESRIISMINKEVIDVNLPGGAFIQRSAFGMAADQMDVMSDKMLNNGVALKTVDEKDGSLQSIISINLFKHIIPNYEKMTFTEARQWLLDHNIIGENSEPQAIGYRIPTQAQASIQALKFMDVLPEIMGDTIVLPEDFTKQTGSDFDIDKLYVSRYQYDKKGNRIQFNDELGMEGNSEDAIKNKLVEQYIKVLTTLEYTNQLKVSIDNATDTVKSVLKKIESKKEVNHQTPFQVYSPHYQEDVKSEYTKGKSGIGPFALNNAHHILTQLMGVKFKSNEFTRALKLINLDKQYDDDGSGRRILDWLSAMINAFVDIAKDPYIVRLNVNQYTFNMTAYLLRMGKGEQTFYFLKQPVIDAVAKAVLNTRGNYGKDNTKTQFEVEKEATQKVLDSFGITESVLEAQREILKDPADLAIHLESLFNGELEKMLLSDNISQEQKNKYQAKVWLAWQAMTPYAKDMADLVKYSKVDTKKMGKSFAAQRIFENGIDRIKDESETRFEYGVLDNFFDNTFLTTKAENSIAFGRSLFENQLLRTTPRFVSTLDNILYRLGKSKSIDERLLRTVVSSMEAAIKSEYFNQKMQERGITPANFFYGENTIARRLMKLRNRIYRGELNDLKNNVVGFNNALLNFLIPNTVKYETTFVEPDYVDVKTMFDQDVHSKNMIITAWEELLQHYDEEVRTLAEDLIYYSFLTSGDNKNMNSFFEFVPTSWRKEYSQFLQDKLDNNETSVNYRDIYLNNWSNNDIVPRIEQSYKEERMGTEGEMIVEEQYFEGIRGNYTLSNSSYAPYIMFTGKAGSKNRIKPIAWYKQQEINKMGISVMRSYPIYPSFVKIRYGSTNSPTSFVVYELIGYNTKVTKAGNIEYTPVYAAVNKKGYRYKGHVITEYGLYQGHAFNLMSIGVTSEDFTNGNIVNLINKSKNLSEEQKKQYSFIFGKNFRYITTLPSYTNLAISDMYRNIAEQEDDSFENQDEELPLPNQEQIETENNPSEYTNHSGGASGADSIWDKIGREFGVINHRHYYQGERSEHNAPFGNIEITTEDYEEGRYKVAQAAKRNYGYQYSAMKDPRLIRNWSQVKYADAIFAIGKIVQPGEKIFPNKPSDTRLAVSPSVTGGTGYAVGMAINEGKPVHVFDQSKKSWFVWNGENFIQEETPVLTKNFAGIGTREIDSFGEQAIRDVYDKTFESEDYKNKEGEQIKKQCKGE